MSWNAALASLNAAATAAFGETVDIDLRGYGQYPLIGEFRAALRGGRLDGLQVEAEQPELLVESSELSRLAVQARRPSGDEGDTLTLADGRIFQVVDVLPPRDGLIALTLMEIAP